MARVKGKLNLNKVPELADNNSLVFAKNVRWFADSFRADYGFDDLGLDFGTYKVVGIIPHNVCFYIFLFDETNKHSAIKVYNENTKEFLDIVCNWNYNGLTAGETTITGYCTTTLYGDVVLTIAEHYKGVPSTLIPLKHIVVGTIDNIGNTIANYDDDETIYTQAPNVPLINLKLLEKYHNTIPAGTYQFFIRYEIRKNHYTNWFPASKELFAGTTRTMLTNQGKVHYVDKTVDSNESFKLRVETVRNVDGFKSFQLGFIIAHDNEVYARAYKHYEIDCGEIYFDYDTEYIEELDVKEIIESVYSLYNVKNVTSYKNRLYISNYIESDFNPNLSNYAALVDIEMKTAQNTSVQKFAGYQYHTNSHDGTSYIESLDVPGISETTNVTIPQIIEELIASPSMKNWIKTAGSDSKTVKRYGITAILEKYTEEDVFDDGSESIDPEDEPIIPSLLDKKYYLTSNGGLNDNNLDIQELLDEIVDDTIGIRLTDGRVMSDAWVINEYYTILYYSATPPRHGLQYKRTTTVTIRFSTNPKDINNDYSLDSSYSLVPHQKYAFYLHFVRPNGEITNGCRIPDANLSGYVYDDFTIQEHIDDTGSADAIYPVFTFNFSIPAGYIGCFISIVHTDYNVAQIFDVREMWSEHGSSDENGHITGDCLELDMALYPALQDIPVIFKSTVVDTQTNEEVTTELETTVDYRSSYDSEFLATFGASGKCVFKRMFDDQDTFVPYVIGKEKYAFIQLPYSANEKYIQLTRCTPFIAWTGDNKVYNDYDSLNLLGYVCRVCKPTSNYDHYFSGQDIYTVIREYDDVNDIYTLELGDVPDTGDIWYTYKDSLFFTVYSNFNLNYVSVRETVIKNLVSKKDGQNVSHTYLLLSFQSLNLSDVYELQPMYRSYTRKMYLPYTEDKNITTFDNTIRSSELQGDEEHINIFKFKPTDYYNVPTNKGKIVNLVAIADHILVHTEDSMFRFSGTNSLMAAGGEDVQMTESEPFDTGIQELFGSEFGYAGLQDKEHQNVSEIGYTFFDRDANRLYLYGDQNQIKAISEDVENLFKHATIDEIHLADDYYNNRIFVCIKFIEANNDVTYATLSYNFIVKSFISLHDFKFDWSFKTKTKCYFVYNKTKIFTISKNIKSYEDLAFTDALYPKTEGKDCIVDVIVNDNFEVVKTLNAISWICNKIDGFKTQYNMAEENYQNNINANPEERYKGDYLRLYSDSCMTDLIALSDRTNDARLRDSVTPYPIINNSDSYTKVRYNLGKWTFNYFRNILNNGSEDNYHIDSTLIYGKYIVARFVFGRTINFKFEDVTLNVTNDYNV